MKPVLQVSTTKQGKSGLSLLVDLIRYLSLSSRLAFIRETSVLVLGWHLYVRTHKRVMTFSSIAGVKLQLTMS